MSAAHAISLHWIGAGDGMLPVLADVAAPIARTFDLPVVVGASAEQPADGYDAKRDQYLSSAMLRWTVAHGPAEAHRVVAVTDRDLFIAVLTYVFGEAQLGGRAAVVSTARLRVDAGGLLADGRLLRARVLKECVHELGHTYGLIHCRDRKCVMSRSNTILDVDQKTADLCRACRSILAEHVSGWRRTGTAWRRRPTGRRPSSASRRSRGPSASSTSRCRGSTA
jgi:archaemetzincin